MRVPFRLLSIGRVLVIYLLGLAGGAQGALYLFDTLDDGVSSSLSGVIALAFIALGVAFIAWTFRPSRSDLS